MKSSTCGGPGLFAALCLTVSQAAGAVNLNVTFSAGSFQPVYNGVPSPVDSVTGSITFSADGFNAPITSIDAVELSIDGHSYALAEVGGRYQSFADIFGGLINGINAMDQASLAPDFVMSFLDISPGHVTSPSFYYTTAAGTDTWRSGLTTIVLTTVPESAPSAMLLLGLGALAAWRRKGTGIAPRG